jgi:SAM-dependent methyltransferase
MASFAVHRPEIRMPSSFLRAIVAALAVCVCSVFTVTACAQQPQAPAATFEPTPGQEGKDVIWLPTPQSLVDKMLDMAKVTPADTVYDLGSGDGRLVITAARRGARALGIEYNPEMVEFAKRAAAREGVTARADFVKADLFDTDLSKATVITMFLLPEINLKLRPKILALKPGTRVVSNSFTMGDWRADETVRLDRDSGCESSYCTALLWIVPARVAGTHKVAAGELTLKQTYQMVSGTLRTDGKTVPVEGKVVGEELHLTAGGRALRGKVSGNRIELQ